MVDCLSSVDICGVGMSGGAIQFISTIIIGLGMRWCHLPPGLPIYIELTGGYEISRIMPPVKYYRTTSNSIMYLREFS